MSTATFRIWRGTAAGGEFCTYTTEVDEGMVVLDAVHRIQASQANDLAVRRALEAAGVEFIDDDSSGPGVRLRRVARPKSS